jgi:hypothetical protein
MLRNVLKLRKRTLLKINWNLNQFCDVKFIDEIRSTSIAKRQPSEGKTDRNVTHAIFQ